MSAEASETGAEAWVGRTLDDRYRIERVLGEGGMGAVFVAHHLRLDKKVALKIILPEHAGNAELASRFAREAMLSAKLDHPHIVSAIDTGKLPEGGAYLVMQLAPGRSLRALVRERPGPRLACEVGAQIADALSAAHALGIVHRDLKPENVVVEERDGGALHARVLDFGIARAMDADKSAGGTPLTRIGTVLGTPGYMPPEQGLGDKVDHRADIYSLGVMVWEMAAGRRLFGNRDSREIALAQLSEPVPALEGAPQALVTLLDEMLAPKRESRPSAATTVRDRLREILATLPAEPATQRDAAPAGKSALEDFATQRTEHAKKAPAIAAPAAREALPTSAAKPAAREAVPTVAGKARPAAATPAAAPSGGGGALRLALFGGGALVLVALIWVASSALEGDATEGTDAGDEPPSETAGTPPVIEPIADEDGAGDTVAVAELPPDPWDADVPSELATLRRRALARRSSPPRSVFSQVGTYAHRHPDDPRPHLLLGHAYARLSWRSDSLERYALALEVDDSARGSRDMLRDLVDMSIEGSASRDASAMLVRVYGAAALPEVERRLAEGRLGRDEEAALTALAARLRAGH